ncbi:hypothetical protein ES704_02049 [subsurface metagenome]|jgi:hypothetical protein
MTFWTLLENPPEEARYWIPIFYYRDPETGYYTAYSPDDILDIWQSWLVPISAGAGVMVDYRCRIFDDARNTIATRDLSNIVVVDGEPFIYDWEPVKKGISPWVILAPVGFLAVIGVVAAAKKK